MTCFEIKDILINNYNMYLRVNNIKTRKRKDEDLRVYFNGGLSKQIA